MIKRLKKEHIMATQKKKKKTKWVRPRHKFTRVFFGATLGTFAQLRYNIKIDKLPKDKRGQYLILYNHQTGFDQFFVGLAFKDPVYYLATEDIFSNGLSSHLIKFLVAPISIRKQTTDVSAIMNCLRVVREGGSIAIAPEGNRTYNGKTVYINPSIATLIKQLKLPVAFYRLEGGYGVQPRWSDVVRRGKMRGYVSRIVQPDEIKTMNEDEIVNLVCTELYVDEANHNNVYKSKKSAEYLERALYVCPKCGRAKLESHGEIVKCTKCGLSAKYTSTTEFEGIDNSFPFHFVNDCYEYQNNFVNKLDLNNFVDVPMFEDEAKMFEVVPNKKKTLLEKNVKLSLYGDRVVVNDNVWSFSDLSAVVVLGKNKLNLYIDGHIYQFKGDERFNALKYVNIFYRYKNIQSGEEDACFLGM